MGVPDTVRDGGTLKLEEGVVKALDFLGTSVG